MKVKANLIPKPPEGRLFALYLHEEGNPNGRSWGSYYHLRARMAVILQDGKDCRDDCQDGGVRYGNFTPETQYGKVDDMLSCLEVNSQGNGEDKQRSLYAWEVRFRDLNCPDLYEMEVGTSILRQVETRMAKEEAMYGRCATFGQYVARVARALGCERILESPPKDRVNGWANGYTYRSHSIPDGAAIIDEMVQDWVQAGEEVTAG